MTTGSRRVSSGEIRGRGAARRAAALAVMGLMGVSLSLAGCGSPASGSCSDAARTATAQLITDLKTYDTVLTPAFMDDCDSGGAIYVSFYVTSHEQAIDEFKGDGICIEGGRPGEQVDPGDALLRCSFPHGAADVLVSTTPLRGEAQVLPSEG